MGVAVSVCVLVMGVAENLRVVATGVSVFVCLDALQETVSPVIEVGFGAFSAFHLIVFIVHILQI